MIINKLDELGGNCTEVLSVITGAREVYTQKQVFEAKTSQPLIANMLTEDVQELAKQVDKLVGHWLLLATNGIAEQDLDQQQSVVEAKLWPILQAAEQQAKMFKFPVLSKALASGVPVEQACNAILLGLAQCKVKVGKVRAQQQNIHTQIGKALSTNNHVLIDRIWHWVQNELVNCGAPNVRP